MGGAVARVGDGDTAFAERSMPFVLNAVTGWHDAAPSRRAHRDWARAVIDAASDASTGRAYVNFLGDADAAQSAYGDETYARLVALKGEYDPTNVFRLNQNIEPDASNADVRSGGSGWGLPPPAPRARRSSSGGLHPLPRWPTEVSRRRLLIAGRSCQHR